MFDKELKEFVSKRYKNSNVAKVKAESVLSSGKRIRPLLCFTIAKHYCCSSKKVMPIAIALELVHSASLVFDDLPFVDNALERRGKKSVHSKYNTMIAVFAGSSAVLDGIRLITEVKDYDSSLKNRLVQLFIDNLSEKGLIGSQEIEMGFKLKNIKTLLKMYEMKASSLFKIACVGSAMVCGANKKDIILWDDFAKHFGIMFQIKDDLLDYSSKKIGKDKQPGKVSLVKKLGKVGGKLYIAKEKKKCLSILKELNVKDRYLLGLLR